MSLNSENARRDEDQELDAQSVIESRLKKPAEAESVQPGDAIDRRLLLAHEDLPR